MTWWQCKENFINFVVHNSVRRVYIVLTHDCWLIQCTTFVLSCYVWYIACEWQIFYQFNTVVSLLFEVETIQNILSLHS